MACFLIVLLFVKKFLSLCDATFFFALSEIIICSVVFSPCACFLLLLALCFPVSVFFQCHWFTCLSYCLFNAWVGVPCFLFPCRVPLLEFPYYSCKIPFVSISYLLIFSSCRVSLFFKKHWYSERLDRSKEAKNKYIHTNLNAWWTKSGVKK